MKFSSRLAVLDAKIMLQLNFLQKLSLVVFKVYCMANNMPR